MRRTSVNPVLCFIAGETSGANDGKPLTLNLPGGYPGRFWLKNRMKDKRPEVRALAKEQYEMSFLEAVRGDIEDDL